MLFGLKTAAWFDLWSVEHVACMMTLITILQQRLRREVPAMPVRRAWWIALSISILLGYCWECVELHIELGLLGYRVRFWMAGQEYWANRWVADTMVCVSAAFWLARKFPWLTVVAGIFTLTWFTLHVVLAPHSMYLQTAEAWRHPLTYIIVGGELCILAGIAAMMRRNFNQDYKGRRVRILTGLEMLSRGLAPGRTAHDEEEMFP